MQIFITDQISNYYIHVTWLSCSSGASLAGFSYFLVKSLPAVHHCVLPVPAVLMKNKYCQSHLSVYSKETIINYLTVTGGFSYFLVKSLPAVHHCVLPVPAVLMKNKYCQSHLSVYSKETIINNLTVTGLTIILICEIKEKNHAARKRGSAILQL
jgi:hypothetical protein